MRISNLFWRWSQDTPVGTWEQRQGKESNKGHVIKIRHARWSGGPQTTHSLGLFSPKAILLVIGGDAESWGRDIRLIPLCWQPAWHMGRMDSMARASSQADSYRLAAGSQVDTHRKRCRGVRGGLLAASAADVAFELHLEEWAAPRRGSPQEEKMAENERQPWDNLLQNSLTGRGWMEMR